MNAPRITGRQARKLLELPDNAASWKIEQRNLAETVAWLFGRPSDETVPGDEHWDTEGFLVEVRDGRVAMFDDEATTTYLSVDQTVDLARALLTAAEEARDGAARLAAIICDEAAARDEETDQ